MIFTDPTLTTGATQVKAAHFSELRTVVNAVQTLAGASLSSFTDPTLSSTIRVKAQHLQELRSSLNSARGILGLAALVFTDATITAQSTVIKAAHITELRNAVK